MRPLFDNRAMLWLAGIVTPAYALSATPDDTNALTTLTPEHAQALICTDASCRAVEATVRAKYQVMVPYQEISANGATVTKCRAEERERTYTVTRCEGGTPLSLNSLSELDTVVAAVLGRHRGQLHLNGLTGLTTEAAAALRSHVGCLYLNGLETLSQDAAEALVEHEGPIELLGLKTVDLATFETLRLMNALPRSVRVENANRRVIVWKHTAPTPFSHVRRMLSNSTGLPCNIDKKAFEKHGISLQQIIPTPPQRVMEEDSALAWLARQLSTKHDDAIVAARNSKEIRFSSGTTVIPEAIPTPDP